MEKVETIVKIKILDVNGIKTFVTAMNRSPYDADVKKDRYVSDAKSIMGLFALDLSTGANLVIYADADDAQKTIESIKQFIVED